MTKTHTNQRTKNKAAQTKAATDKVRKKLSDRETIELNRERINGLMCGNNFNRINNTYWFADEMRKETSTLFQAPESEKKYYLSYTSINNVCDAWNYITSNRATPIDIGQICKLHTILTKGTDIIGGAFRTCAAYTERLQMHAPDYHLMLQRLDDIVYNINNTKIDALTRAFDAHFDLIAAQPFNDFNKRTARMTMNWVLIQNGYRPILFNRKSDKDEYMAALLANAQGDRKTYMHYMYKCLIRSQNDCIKMLTQSKVY